MNGPFPIESQGPRDVGPVCAGACSCIGFAPLRRTELACAGLAGGTGRAVLRCEQRRPNGSTHHPQSEGLAAPHPSTRNGGTGSRRLHRANPTRRAERLQPVRRDLAANRRLPRQATGSWSCSWRSTTSAVDENRNPSATVTLGHQRLAPLWRYPSRKHAAPSVKLALVRSFFVARLASQWRTYKKSPRGFYVC